MRACLVFIILTFVSFVAANVEKIVFKAPEARYLPKDASLDHLSLISLNPGYTSVRTRVNASFPTITSPKGTTSWFLVEGLEPRKRYEVRICWLATQPTLFWLHEWDMSHVFETPELVSSLTEYSNAQRIFLDDTQKKRLILRRPDWKPESSLLFLQVFAKADYFSLNNTLMENVPPVPVDIILDPYVFNIIPQTLLPTIGYITVVSITAWLLSGWMYKFVLGIAQPNMKRVEEGKPNKIAKREN